MFTLKMQHAESTLRAALIQFILAADDGGINGISTVHASIQVDNEGDAFGQFVVGHTTDKGVFNQSMGGGL